MTFAHLLRVALITHHTAPAAAGGVAGVGAAREAMPGSVVTVQLGQCGNQVRRGARRPFKCLCYNNSWHSEDGCPTTHTLLTRLRAALRVQVGADLFSTLAAEAEAAPPPVRAEIHQVRCSPGAHLFIF